MMRRFFVFGMLIMGILGMTACSVFGESGVPIAPYQTLKTSGNIDVRTYERMVLVSTPMGDGSDERRSPFRRLFKYITGSNTGAQDIPMTAPVFMKDGGKEQGTQIPMTAPVFMDGASDTMSFVLPADYTLESAPKPTDPSVTLEEITDYTVAVIQFSGRLSDENLAAHEAKLRAWMNKNGYEASGPALRAGYNAPFTLPAMRRNEVLIPVIAR